MAETSSEAALDVVFQRAVEAKINGDYDTAEALLHEVLAAASTRADAYRELGLVLGFTGRFDESIAALERAVELDPSDLKGRNDLALSYSMLGMYDEAKAEFERVLEKDPENTVALRNIVFFQ